jgi:hypothetical protein
MQKLVVEGGGVFKTWESEEEEEGRGGSFVGRRETS